MLSEEELAAIRNAVDSGEQPTLRSYLTLLDHINAQAAALVKSEARVKELEWAAVGVVYWDGPGSGTATYGCAYCTRDWHGVIGGTPVIEHGDECPLRPATAEDGACA